MSESGERPSEDTPQAQTHDVTRSGEKIHAKVILHCHALLFERDKKVGKTVCMMVCASVIISSDAYRISSFSFYLLFRVFPLKF